MSNSVNLQYTMCKSREMERKIVNRDLITKSKKNPTTEKTYMSTFQKMLLNGPQCFDRSLLKKLK